MAAIAVLGEFWEWEIELLSLWADDLTLERSILDALIVHDQTGLNNHLGVLDSLGELYYSHGKLGPYGKKLEASAK